MVSAVMGKEDTWVKVVLAAVHLSIYLLSPFLSSMFALTDMEIRG